MLGAFGETHRGHYEIHSTHHVRHRHHSCGIIRHMTMGLTDSQLAAVIDAARSLPVEKRDVYLQRIAAMLTMRGRGHFNDADVSDVAKLAIAGLCQTADTAA
jgi:hypothetical protein